jgi:polysaccharide biosynthesis/export protein
VSRRFRTSRFAAPVLCIILAGCGGGKAPATTPASAAPAMPAQEPAAAPEFVSVPTSDIPTVPATPKPAGSTSGGSYVVAVEDVLEISVYGDPDLTRQVPVRPDGMISYTFIGDVKASGRTIEEIRAEMKERLGAYLRTPEVTVIAKEFGRQKVYVGGEVRQPGVFYLTARENTLVDVVYRAGLPTEKADVTRALLVRNGRLVPVDFSKIVKGDLAGNLSMENNDLVYIPEASERYIYVLGEVRNQNAIETTIPLSILNVLTRSAVLRGGLKDPKVAVVNFRRLVEGDLSQNIQVQPGDIVYVPTTGLGRYNQFIEQILRTFTLLFQGRVVQQGFQ